MRRPGRTAVRPGVVLHMSLVLDRPTAVRPTSVRTARVGSFTGTAAGVGAFTGTASAVGTYTGRPTGTGSYVRSER